MDDGAMKRVPRPAHRSDPIPILIPRSLISITCQRVHVRAVLITMVRDGKIAEVHHYFDVMSLMLQLGAGARPMTPIIETPTAETPPAVH